MRMKTMIKVAVIYREINKYISRSQIWAQPTTMNMKIPVTVMTVYTRTLHAQIAMSLSKLEPPT